MKIFEFLKPIMRIFILFIVMSFIIACYYIDSRDYYAIEVNIRNVDMSDKRISLFIPKYLKSEHIIPENTESSGYNTDGYKYMFYRYGCDYRTEKTGDSTYTVEMRIGGNPDGKSEVKHVCTNYKDFKVVVFDNNENILKVSEACDFNLKEYEVLYKIDYDYITNTATPEYTYYRSFYLVRYQFSITVMILLMPI
ncbi:MAG: hypothetical protein K2J39_07310, partial [Ruminococcus sp.]|nr:hypothetical protein [Ruminococcus sp.]